jgi:hypothetical protein
MRYTQSDKRTQRLSMKKKKIKIIQEIIEENN